MDTSKKIDSIPKETLIKLYRKTANRVKDLENEQEQYKSTIIQLETEIANKNVLNDQLQNKYDNQLLEIENKYTKITEENNNYKIVVSDLERKIVHLEKSSSSKDGYTELHELYQALYQENLKLNNEIFSRNERETMNQLEKKDLENKLQLIQDNYDKMILLRQDNMQVMINKSKDKSINIPSHNLIDYTDINIRVLDTIPIFQIPVALPEQNDTEAQNELIRYKNENIQLQKKIHSLEDESSKTVLLLENQMIHDKTLSIHSHSGDNKEQLDKRYFDAQNQTNHLLLENESLSAKLTSLTESFTNEKQLNKSNQNQLDYLKDKLMNIKNDTNLIKTTFGDITSISNQLISEHLNISELLQGKMSDSSDRVESAQLETHKLQSEYSVLRDEYHKLMEKNNELFNTITKIESDHNSLIDKIHDRENQIDHLKAAFEYSSIENEDFYSKLVDNYNILLLKLKKNEDDNSQYLNNYKSILSKNSELIEEIGNISTLNNKYKKTIIKLQSNNKILENELKDFKCEIYNDSIEILECHMVNGQLQYYCKLKNDNYKWFDENYIVNYDNRTNNKVIRPCSVESDYVKQIENQQKRFDVLQKDYNNIKQEYDIYKIKAKKLLSNNNSITTNNNNNKNLEITNSNSAQEDDFKKLKDELDLKNQEVHDLIVSYDDRILNYESKIAELERKVTTEINKEQLKYVNELTNLTSKYEKIIETNSSKYITLKKEFEILQSDYEKMQISRSDNSPRSATEQYHPSVNPTFANLAENNSDNNPDILPNRKTLLNSTRTLSETTQMNSPTNQENKFPLPILNKSSSSKRDLITSSANILATIMNSNIRVDSINNKDNLMSSQANDLKKAQNYIVNLEEENKDLKSQIKLNDKQLTLLKEELSKYEPIEVVKIQGVSKDVYTKNILLKFLTINNNEEKLSLLPVLSTLIPFSTSDIDEIKSNIKDKSFFNFF